MKCFELKNDTLREGLLIDDESGLPRINVSSDKKKYLELDARLTAIYQRAPKIAPIRMHYAALSKDRKTISMSKKNDHLALLLICALAGQGGDVTLSGCAFQETVMPGEARVQKLYGPFPSEGIEVLGEVPEMAPWFGGATVLELAVLMLPGASFRVTRTGKVHAARPHTYLYWNGYQMIDTPKKTDTKTKNIPMRHQFTDEEREEVAVASERAGAEAAPASC